MSTRTVLTKSSRNVFADLGFPESEAQNLALRSDLMIRIEKLVRDSGMTQQQAAKTLGVTQPRLNALLKGKIADFTLHPSPFTHSPFTPSLLFGPSPFTLHPSPFTHSLFTLAQQKRLPAATMKYAGIQWRVLPELRRVVSQRRPLVTSELKTLAHLPDCDHKAPSGMSRA